MARTAQAWIRWSLFFSIVGLLAAWSAEATAQRKRPKFEHRTPNSVPSGKDVVLRGVITHAEDLDTATIKYRKIRLVSYGE